MRDRQVAWSDPTLRGLASAFVTCADEVHRLQTGDDAECRLFRGFADAAHYREPGTTRQGIYAVSPSGLLLGSTNQRDPRRIENMLRGALAVWHGLDAEARRLSAEQRAALQTVWRWEDGYPEDGLVLEVTTRDLPRAAGRDTDPLAAARPDARTRWTDRAWNRDYVWYRLDEVTDWLPGEPAVGAVHAVPRELVERLVRFHLVDNVRGQTPAYGREEVRVGELAATVITVDDEFVRLRLHGATRAEVASGERPRWFAATLDGEACWSRVARRFVAFELVAVGERAGATRFNNRDRDRGPAPIGVVMRLAPADAPRIAPAFVWAYGWETPGRSR